MILYGSLIVILALFLLPVALHVANECRGLWRNWRLDNVQVWAAQQAARLDVLERYDYHEAQRERARLEIRRHRARLLAEVDRE